MKKKFVIGVFAAALVASGLGAAAPTISDQAKSVVGDTASTEAAGPAVNHKYYKPRRDGAGKGGSKFGW